MFQLQENYRLSTNSISHSLESISQDPKKMFANKVVTDGSSLIFLFSREARPNIQNVELELTDFTLEELNELFRPCALDPGRTNAYTAAYGCGPESHAIVRYTTDEYYHSLKTKAEVEFKKKKEQTGVDNIEKKFPTAKIISTAKYYQYAQYVLSHCHLLYEFYGPIDGKLKYFNYKNKKKALSESVNILVNGGKKYRKKKNANTKKNRRKKRREQKKCQQFIQ